MNKTKRALQGLALAAILTLSFVATSAPAFAAQSKGDDSALVSKGRGKGTTDLVIGSGVTWEGAFTALGSTWE